MENLDFVELFGSENSDENTILTFLALIANLQPDVSPDHAFDYLAEYVLEAAENDDDLVCHKYLIATGTQYLADQAQNAPAMEAAAAAYIGQLLIRILQSEEPNKVFKRTKPTAGPKRLSRLTLMTAVALPETRRRRRLLELKNRLADNTLSRRERASLSNKHETIKDPKHVKLGKTDDGIDSSYYSQRRIDDIMAEFGEAANFLFELENQLE